MKSRTAPSGALRARSPGRRRARRLLPVIAVAALAGGSELATAPLAAAAERPLTDLAPLVFTNPLLRPPAQDPQITHHAGRYYYCESNAVGVFLREADHFADLARAPAHRVWTPPADGPISRNIWAPELHLIDGRAYIYVAADNGDNAHHRMAVLEAETSDLLGPWRLASVLDTGGWAIDGTVLTLEDGHRFFVWSGWPGVTNGQQNLYIAAMNSPTELAGRRVLLKQPDQPWERRAMPICEGPQILRRHGRTFLLYSASGSWTADYCLGMLVLEPGADPLRPGAWHRAGQVFARNQHALGVGHCGFVQSPDGREDWLVYHTKTRARHGWDDREVRAQPFTWDEKGWPVFGEPTDPARPLLHPVHTEEMLAERRVLLENTSSS